MTIKKVEMTGSWNQNTPLYVMACYFIILYPFVQFYLRDMRWASQYAYICFQALALLIFIRIPGLKELGWSTLHIRQNLIIGGTCGITMISTLPLLDLLAKQLDIAKSIPAPEARWQIDALFSILLLPLLEQSFFTGFISQSLIKKLSPIPAIYFSAVIFTLAHFTMSLGAFSLGFIAAGLYYLTGTLYAPLVFHISCRLADTLLTHAYPHLVTFLRFLL